LFSAGAIVYTKWFNAFFNQHIEGADVDQQVIQILSEKAEEIEVMFYGRAGWFSSNHLALRHYANWCIKEADGNFGLNTARKAKEYLQYCVDRYALLGESRTGGSSSSIIRKQLAKRVQKLWQAY
jgi:hypothetical protein